MTGRDYMAEMRKLIEEHCPPDRGGWAAAVEADKIVDELLVRDRDLLHGWLRAYAKNALRMWIDEISRSRRSRPGRGKQYSRVLEFYQQHSCEGNIRKMASEMTAADHRFVSRHYGRLAKRSGYLAAFHRAVAAKIADDGVKTTEEAFTEVSYQTLYESALVGPTRRVA